MRNYTAQGVRDLHPRIASIISDTVALQLPRKLACGPLLEVLQGCPIITTRAADEVTGRRYGKSTIREYAMLARVASERIKEYIAPFARSADAALAQSPH